MRLLAPYVTPCLPFELWKRKKSSRLKNREDFFILLYLFEESSALYIDERRF